MTRDEAVLLILNRTGQRGGAGSPVDTVLQAQVITEMKFMQEQLEMGEIGLLPWFLKTEYTDASFKTSASSPLVAVPTGFLREQEDLRVALFWQDTTRDDEWVPLDKVDYDEGKTLLGGSVPGKPEAYTLLGLNYRFWPEPDGEYPLKALIYMADTVLSTNIENKWLKYAGQLLIGKTGEVIAGFGVRDERALEYFTKMAAAGLAGLIRQNTAMDEAARERQQGED